MTRILSVVSGKGGVGKTTLVTNLSTSLVKAGKNVLVIDGNVTGSNLHIHLGIEATDNLITLNDVLDGKAFITQAIYRHPIGFSIIPASLSKLKYDNKEFDLKNHIFELLGEYDVILIDAAAGLGEEVQAAINSSDISIIITNPDPASLINALHTKKLLELKEKDIVGIVLNKVRGEKDENNKEYVEEYVGLPVVCEIPYHHKIRRSVYKKQPIVHSDPHLTASRRMKNLAYKLVDEEVPKENIIEQLKVIIFNI
ncbi:MAG: hypothetical protein DRN66_03365 [Candidatus Nanohalarchaeota archaeon]|nr:MAG: hypothetical protein DRN66_03365 [Candidatus Nanohaloarchaeota archaeon]